MTLWRVQTDSWCSKEFDSLELATVEFERRKDYEMEKGVIAEESFIELVSSHNDFENETIVNKVVAAVDEEAMAVSDPVEEGFDYQYWAKWIDVTCNTKIKS